MSDIGKVLLIIEDINIEIIGIRDNINSAKYYIKEAEEMLDNLNRYLIDIENIIDE